MAARRRGGARRLPSPGRCGAGGFIRRRRGRLLVLDDTTVRLVGSAGLALGALAAWRRPLLLGAFVGLAVATAAVALLAHPSAAIVAWVAWPAAALLALALLARTTRLRDVVAYATLGALAAMLVLREATDALERTLDASQQLLLAAFLGLAAHHARRGDTALTLAYALYPALTLGVALPAFDLSPSDLLLCLGLLGAYGASVRAHHVPLALTMGALPLLGMLAWVQGVAAPVGAAARLGIAGALVVAMRGAGPREVS